VPSLSKPSVQKTIKKDSARGDYRNPKVLIAAFYDI